MYCKASWKALDMLSSYLPASEQAEVETAKSKVLPTHVIHHYPNLFLFWGEINHLGCFGLPTGQEIGHNHKRPEPEVLEVQ